MNPQIRPIESDDVAGCVTFGLESFRPVFNGFEEHYGTELFNVLRPDWEHAQSTYIKEACTSDDKETWVSVADGKATGFIVLVVNVDSGLGEIELLAVNPDYQGGGIGTALNDFGTQRLREAGMQFAIVATGTDPGHAPARRSYEKAGFTPMAIQPHLLTQRL